MTLKIISFIFVISLAFGISAPTQVKDVPFDVNEVINQVPHRQALPPNPCPLNPELTGEFLIDTNVVYVPAPGWQAYPSVAFDGTNYLVVWEGGRFSDDIYGTRVNQTGQVLDPAGIAISTADYSQYYPSVAFDGTNYLVVWIDWRSGSYIDIYGARVSQAGQVLDPTGFAISTANNSQWVPSIAFNGINYLVVWGDERNGSFNYDIYGARVNQAGQVLDPEGIAISTAINSQRYPVVAFNSTNYLVVWQDDRSNPDVYDIYGARVNQAGQILDPEGIPISTAAYSQYYPSITFEGTNYFVVWEDYRSGSYSDIYGTRVNQTGLVLDPTGIAISTGVNSQGSPSVAFNSNNYLVIWQDERSGSLDIYGARVNQTGLVLDPIGFPISSSSGSQWSPSLSFGGTNYLTLWVDNRSGSFDIYGARVNQAVQILDPTGIVISTGANSQGSPSVAFDGTNYLVVWEDDRSVYTDIYGARVNQTGQVLDLIGIAISTANYRQNSPSVAFDGSNYLVVWTDYRNNPDISDIYGARVNQTGLVLDPIGIAISTAAFGQSSPSIAFDGTNYLVVWVDGRGSDDIYGVRVSQAGQVLDPTGIAISTADYGQYSPSVGFDGTNYLVLWEDYRRSGSNTDIYGTMVSQAGQIINPSGIAISTAENDQRYPSQSFDGTNYLVVWEDDRNNLDVSDIYGARVSQTGQILDPTGIEISTAAYDHANPSVTFDGTNYLIVWEDWSIDYPDIYGARVNQAGVVIDSFAITVKSGDQLSPNLAKGSGNQVLITYSGWTDEYIGRTYNAMRIWGKFYPFVGMGEERNTLDAKRLTPEIYPNPARAVIRVHGPWIEKTIKIFDVSGKMVKEIASPPKADRNDRDGEMKISLKGISPGIYFLRLGNETKKFLVVK